MTAGSEMPKAYDPSTTEEKWYAFWEKHGLFAASDDPDDTRPTYTIAMPPPNVTGSLHMGHACRTTFEDVLIRYHRMRGENALWIPGTDHAGIATQVVVERKLQAENLTRHDLGREKFVERVWQWRETAGDRILSQKRVLGASADWSRTKFTMDPDLSVAVREAFCRLYEEGLIYRSTRLVNWDVVSQTVLSDLEVETEENVQGELYEFAYPTEEGGEVVVATTRPETMLGDTAVAVHPDDPRYAHLHGKFVKHPFVDRRIPVVCDAELVDMEFGTGVVKVTPAHDFNDFATGKRHDLEEINIFHLDGTVNENGGEFAGMDRFVARKAVKAKLAELGLERGKKPYTMTLPRSQRSHSVVEPMISTQWFVKAGPLAEPAIEAVESGKTVIIPEDWTKTYYHWMRNIQDWCISRQLWWGHPIPAWYCEEHEHVTVARTAPDSCSECGSKSLRQDPDVLDTWFSSGLWPFSTLGWPEQTLALKRFYPTQDMETGYDILFFWVARMMMMGIHFMGEPPFSRVLLSGMVTDENGDKMSKVKGNVVDPLDVIHGATLQELLDKAEAAGAKPSGLKYLKKTYPKGFEAHGADALRFTLLSYSPQTRRIALSLKRVEGYRHFCNKLWNAARYSLMQLEGSGAVATGARPEVTHLANRWVLSRLDAACQTANRGLDDYRLDDASGALYHFVWDELCDWYLELSKPLLASDDAALKAETQATLVHVLETTLRLLHPMMPFLTEEIWQRLPKDDDASVACMVARYPQPGAQSQSDPEAEREMAVVQEVIGKARNVRAENDISKRAELTISFRPKDEDAKAILQTHIDLTGALAGATLTLDAPDAPEPDFAATFVTSAGHAFVPLEGLVDRDKERERLQRELKKVDKDLTVTEKKLANEGFVQRAPAEVVQTERERLAELKEKHAQLTAAVEKLR